MTHLGDRLAGQLEMAPNDDRVEIIAHLRRQRAQAVARRAADLYLITIIDHTLKHHTRSNP